MSKPSIESFIELGKKIDRLQSENLRYHEALLHVKHRLETVRYSEYQTLEFRRELFNKTKEALEHE